MSSQLRPPTIITRKDGVRELIWTLPNAFHGSRFQEILREESGVQSTISQNSKNEVTVKAIYNTSKSNEVIFACFIFHRIAKQCEQLNSLFRLP